MLPLKGGQVHSLGQELRSCMVQQKKLRSFFWEKKKMDSVKLVHSFNSDENMKEHTLVLTKLWLESHLHYFMSVPEFHLSRTSILHT